MTTSVFQSVAGEVGVGRRGVDGIVPARRPGHRARERLQKGRLIFVLLSHYDAVVGGQSHEVERKDALELFHLVHSAAAVNVVVFEKRRLLRLHLHQPNPAGDRRCNRMRECASSQPNYAQLSLVRPRRLSG